MVRIVSKSYPLATVCFLTGKLRVQMYGSYQTVTFFHLFLAVGNYRAVKGAEDYELWVRMLQAGYRAETAAGTAAEINMSRRLPPEAVPASSPAKSADREISYPAMRFVYR